MDEPTRRVLPTYTLGEYAAYFVRNLTPRTIFANLLALAWILAASALVRWLTRMRSASEAKAAARAARQRLHSLGFVRLEDGTIAHRETYIPPKLGVERLLMIPHGRTPSNVSLLFQSHAEGPDGELLPESRDEAAAGAAEFLKTWGARLRTSPKEFVFVRSPLRRCEQTAAVYVEAMAALGLPTPEIIIEDALVEIDHASWHGKRVEDLTGAARQAAAAYRRGDFLSRPADGESLLDLMVRCRAWLGTLDEGGSTSAARTRGRVVVAFGHGTFQNACETLLRTFGERPVKEVFTREKGRSHLRRGYAHGVWEP